MTVISAGIVNSNGRIVLARQFTEISRVRIEGLLSAFPRLLETSANRTITTYIDSESVRYVYQPLEDTMYLVLVTTTTSNIVEDLATLHLMGRLIPEYTEGGITESSLEANAFHIFFAFDEVVVGGKRENVFLEQVQTYLEMDSHEERRALELKRQQIENAKHITNEQARIIRQRKLAGEMSGGGAYGGIGSDDVRGGGGGYGGDGGYGQHYGGGGGQSVSYGQTETHSSYSGAYGGGGGGSSAAVSAAAAPRSVMSLNKARKADKLSKVQQEVGRSGGGGRTPPPMTTPPPTAAPAPAATGSEGVNVVIQERICSVLGRDGEPSAATDIKGELTVFIADPQMDHVKLHLAPLSNEFTFRAHAKINKTMFSADHVLSMADNKPFPVQQPVTILRWKLNNPGSIQAPVAFTCWPEQNSIVIEYELKNANAPPLDTMQLQVPLYGAAAGNIVASVGEAQLQGGCVLWTVPVVDGLRNSSGNIEIHLNSEPTMDETAEVFFPVNIQFSSAVSVGMVHVKEVVDMEHGNPIRFGQTSALVADGFQIE